MIHSMTGFGRATKQLATKKISVEIKSLNSKQLDLNVRIPSYYRSKELDLRSLLANNLFRGKVELSIYVEITGDDSPHNINIPIVQSYMNDLKKIYSEASEEKYLSMAMRLPDSIKNAREELSEDEWNEVYSVVKNALEEILNYRKQEGDSLEVELKMRADNIYDLLLEVPKYEKGRVDSIKERIKKAIDDLNLDIDNNRFEQELIYYIEKLDVSEEKQRLNHHLDYFREQLATKDPNNGKKLGFISQEIGREINTLGSKSNNSDLQRIVVQMKDELEKIKEQVLNVL
jgi:uncharacterized protein (TIGR00255 family)